MMFLRCRLLETAGVVLVLLAMGGVARAQQDTMEVTLDAVTVSAGALPVQLRNATRTVEVIDARAIRNAVPSGVDDVLRGLGGVHVQRRGGHGTQADLSMRGGTFSQTLVLVDGMRVSDPQTGHHALHIPIPLAMIERIEVLPGHGSALLGADALGGAVNLVTARGGSTQYQAGIEGGDHGLRRLTASAGYGGEQFPSHTAAEYAASDGWREGTAFTHLTVSHLSRAALGGAELSLLAGYADRDFGAFDFYSPGRGIPSHERVRVGHAALGARGAVGPLLLRARLSFRDLRDRFHFDTRIPDRFVNEHHTQVLGGELRGILPAGDAATLSIGLEAAADRITSSNLGTHDRAWLAVSAATQWRAAEWIEFDGGLRLDAHRDHSPQLNPTFGALLRPGGAWLLRMSVGRSFRLPTYTDLYYSDPATEGNPSLYPESAWSAEAGVEWRPSHTVTLGSTAFLRDQRDLIDYVQQTPADPFVARNFTAATVRGWEVRIQWSDTRHALLGHADAALALLANMIDTRGAARVRYALSAPARMLRIRLGGRLPAAIEWTALVLAADQQIARDYVTMDLRLRKDIGAIGLFLAVDNASNSAIEEFPGLPLPGRWVRGGVEVRM